MLQTDGVPRTRICFLAQVADVLLCLRMLLYAHLKLAKYGLLRQPPLSLFVQGKLMAYEHQFFRQSVGAATVVLRLPASMQSLLTRYYTSYTSPRKCPLRPRR
jgi:hypothetical protein